MLALSQEHVFAEFGVNVTCVDKDEEKIKTLEGYYSYL